MNVISKNKIPIVSGILPMGLLFLTSCSSFDPMRGMVGSYRSYTEIKGTIKDGRYFSPDGNFSCPVPKLIQPGAIIKDSISKEEETSAVMFSDDFEMRLAITWFKVPANIKLASDSALLEQAATFMKERDQKSIPNVTIENEKLDLGDQSELFYVAKGDMPGVKVYIPPQKRKNVRKEMLMPHIFRGHLILRRGDWIYVLTMQQDTEFEGNTKTLEQEESELRSKLEESLKEFEFK